MRKQQLASRLARQSGVVKAVAADQLERVVHDILTRLRKGEPASLPGLGTFVPGHKPRFRFDPGVRRRGGTK